MPTLADILGILEMRGGNLNWAVLSLWATGKAPGWGTVVDFEKTVAALPNGYPLTWGELEMLAGSLDQVIDGVFIGCRDPEALHRYPSDSDLYASCDVVVEANDGTYWEIHTSDAEIVARLRRMIDDNGSH